MRHSLADDSITEIEMVISNQNLTSIFGMFSGYLILTHVFNF